MIKIALFLSLLLTSYVIAGVNILVVGSSEGFDKRETPQGHDKHLDLSKFAKTMENTLNKGESLKNGTTVVYEDVFLKKSTPVALGSRGNEIPTEFMCHSFAQYYFWPDGRDKRLAKLSGKDDTKWDYVILVGDPYIISQMPGIYAEGVHLLSEKIKQSEAKILLLMPWHSDDAINKNISEVVYRVGQGLGIPVAPASDTWTATQSKLAAGDAEYLASAAVFSAVSGHAAWGESTTHQQLAKKTLEIHKKNETKADYSEYYETPNPFAMKYLKQKQINFCQTGTSSEAGIRVALIDAMKRCDIIPNHVNINAPDIDFNYGRGNSNFEANKRYKVDPKKFDRSYGFPMQEQSKSADTSMLYGIDKRYFNGRSYDDGTDLGIAYDMIRDNEVQHDVRAVPIRLLWAKLHDAKPDLKPLRDRWHMSRFLDSATGTFMLTLLTEDNPVGDEPADKDSDEWNHWMGRKIGYETAIRMGKLSIPK